ncbi:D-alanine--poly(phosphoribitol) ligase (plasmid) [Brasilonema octagenarum UFV-E1]|uniref:D-alanine--poly(Phosphoribitol) ligase n=2 Tax=Brasilonema TaxID=383614 RepID=A0A856MR70_9CYAN|nr:MULTISPECIES: amino acid adenylation domain-containing protein [Brasilonema]NMF62559.1 D-alanine--poly(phosphoribitol) ligase [Brasilonema octagenarum UFV-OR1]QDL12660.1 D-alanine--poly(phosphoribitol) ligase [Brasilonema sennae CENA114]QDL19054.1 D-alanine--poly(phosphoribitol) ligase [Brasilonema octagenarum UFV-E1]
MSLQNFLILSAKRTPDALAIRGPDGSITYGELDRLANRIAKALTALGVCRGDRVGIWLDKSVRAVATMQGVLRLGAAYVPIDPLGPAVRTRTILKDCAVKALITTEKRAEATLTNDLECVACLCTDGIWKGQTWNDLVAFSDEPVEGFSPADDDLAYILYTSGSTGKPKGVCISHRNALAFIEWAAQELQATPADRFSNHAPFHFDLSVLDLYVAFHVGASVSLVPDGMSYAPKRLVDFITQETITIWYSVPSALILMMEQGGLLDRQTLPLRAILFAGEPFSLKHLRRLYEYLPSVRFLNLYGPTETNVCTFYEVQGIEPDRTKPVPIGRACSGNCVWALKDDGTKAKLGEEGELIVSGPTVMLGYWGHPPQGDKPYATGDIVRLLKDDNYLYVGRRDHLVKVRGHRVELGDIEAALAEHPEIHEAAVVVSGSGIDARLTAFVVSTGDLPLLSIKRHCAERLPRYMIVDDVRFIAALPRTRNGKIDRQRLTQEAVNITSALSRV